jgi:hypothetical protein
MIQKHIGLPHILILIFLVISLIGGFFFFSAPDPAPVESPKERALKKINENSFSGTAFGLSDDEKGASEKYGL